MKNIPLIGISANFKEEMTMLARQYYEAVILAGGVPVVIPVITDNETLTKIIYSIDGLLLIGGGDIAPKFYGEKPIPELGKVNPLRDEYELKIIQIAHARNIPILGICRGMQMLNVAFGGSLYQDIFVQNDCFLLNHQQSEPKNLTTHNVIISKKSRIAKIVGTENLDVNSSHHQAVKLIADGFTATAFSNDGICETIESNIFLEIGVQWHPEHLVGEKQNEHLKIFKWLVKEAKNFYTKNYFSKSK
ncbi:MAG: gamma-glutamyl-gamma-aminobutyrate hydrolase family protein [Paludibacter sp.]|nr:gamma-glutamyl-gamma-aminobutyrate hydrolase family protein [Paludibacter sp.]